MPERNLAIDPQTLAMLQNSQPRPPTPAELRRVELVNVALAVLPAISERIPPVDGVEIDMQRLGNLAVDCAAALLDSADDVAEAVKA